MKAQARDDRPISFCMSRAKPDFGVRILKRADTKDPSADIQLTAARYGFGASWDDDGGNAKDVDIDLQCVVVDSNGVIIDCAYYNNMKAVRAITHSGDEVNGRADKIEEMVWVNMKKLPQNVSLLIFVVAAFSGGSLADAANGRLHVLENNEDNEVAVFEMERSTKNVDVVAVMFKDISSGWKIRIVDNPAENGRHFMDILPTLSTIVRGFIPSAPTKQKVAFAMEKGSVMDLPANIGLITVGLGWDVDDGEADLDVSAVLLDREGMDCEAVFFGRLESKNHGIVHTGDNLTGEGEGDDEQIRVQVDAIGGEINSVVFVVNIYSPGRTFAQVANPFCRVVDESAGQELCRYSLRDAGRDNGLIIAKLVREVGGRWGFHALGIPCRGRTFKDSLQQIREANNIKTRSLVVRSNSHQDCDLVDSSSLALAGPPKKSAFCHIQ